MMPLALTSLCVALSALQEPLLDAKVRDLLHEELSGELAKEHVIAITRHHRIQGSRGYRTAAQYVLGKLREYGFDEQHAWIESYPSDGKVVYQTWQSPSGWDIESAELRMLEPSAERIIGYPEIAMSVVTYSNTGDVTAELVWVGSGEKDEDYAGKDVRGKLALATGYGGVVHRLAVLKYGAAAVVCYLDDERAQEYPDMLQYTGMWPKTDELARTTFGFNLTNRQGTKLRALLESGEKVVLRGQVKGIGLEPFFMDVIVAKIDGAQRPDEELVFSAHLDHPKESANDNASGSGAILDVARGLEALIDSGRLPRPGRSLRFLWVPEWYGTMAYIDAHPEVCGPELGGKVLANMNLDMVGENLELLHSKLILTRTPESLPSVVNDVVANMAEMVDGMDVRTPRGSLSVFNYRVTPYSGGSDHMMFLDRKIPAVMFSHAPDYTHHTSEDTPDKVDPVQLERCELIAAGTMWHLANLTESQAVDLVWLGASSALAELGLDGLRARRMIEGTDRVSEPWSYALSLVEGSHDRQARRLRSVLAFSDSELIRQAIAFQELALDMELQAARIPLGKHVPVKAGVLGADAPWNDVAPLPLPGDPRIPARTTRGPLAFDLPESKLDADPERDYGLSEDQRFEIVNFVDGERSLGAIRALVAAEYGPVELEKVAHFVEDLVSVGALKWR